MRAGECGRITLEELELVFEMGYRDEEARTRGEGRGGLGLAVDQGLAQADAGQITIRSEATGCRFTVGLPLHHLSSGVPATA